MAADHGRGGPHVLDPPIGARADEHPIDRDRRDRRAGLRAMYSSAAATALRSVGIGELGRIGHVAADIGHLGRRGAPGDLRLHVAGVGTSRRGRISRPDRSATAASGHGGVEILRRKRPAAQIGERLFVGRDQSRPGAGLDRHVADRHPLLHGQPADRLAGVLDAVADAAAGREPADEIEDQVLGRDARAEPAIDADLHRLRLVLQERLGGQHVLDFAGADAEGQRAEGAVRGGVAIAADDGHARLGIAQFGADHVDDRPGWRRGCRRGGCRSRGSCAAACRSAASRSGRRSAGCDRSSARCDRWWPHRHARQVGALAFGVGTSEVEHVLATQTLLQHKPKTMEISVDDRLGPGVTAKNLILYLIGRLSTSGGVGYCIEYTGEAIRA